MCIRDRCTQVHNLPEDGRDVSAKILWKHFEITCVSVEESYIKLFKIAKTKGKKLNVVSNKFRHKSITSVKLIMSLLINMIQNVPCE